MTSVVLADDQPLVRSGLRLILELAEVQVVGEAGDGAEAARLARDLVPDVVLMDVRMPGVDGIEGTRRIAAAGLPTRVLVLTTFDLDEHVHEALAAGAAGFLLKNASAAELVSAVERTAAGDNPMAPSVLRRIIDHYVQQPLPSGGDSSPKSSGLHALSPRECEVLALMAVGLTNQEITDRLVISQATVKTHVRSILAKLGARDRIQAVLIAHRHGVVAEP